MLKLPATYAIEMQLLGGIWMGQIFPAVVCGAFTRWFDSRALLAGWLLGMVSGTGMAASLGLRSSVYPVHLLGRIYPMYALVPALVLNLAAAAIGTLVLRARESRAVERQDETDRAMYFG